MFSLPSDPDDATYQSYSPAGGSDYGENSRSGSQSPSGLAESNNAGPSTLPSTLGSSRKRRAQLSPINLINSTSNETDELNIPSTSGSTPNSDEESSGHLPRAISKSNDPHDKRIRLTSSSSTSSTASLLSLISDGSQSSLQAAESYCDLTDPEFGSNTPSAKLNHPARTSTFIADGEFELFGNGQECKAIHIQTDTIYHCMALNQEDYLSFMSVAERIEAAKNRLTSDELRELRRLIMPEETRVVKAENGKTWYMLSPDHQGSLQTFYVAENSAIASARTHSPWSEQESKAIFRQIVRLVSYCHQIGIYFGDFRLQKIVYTDRKNNLIRVLSLRKIYVAPLIEDDMIPKPDTKCCPAYIAPEMMMYNKPYSAKAADIWSLGILLFVLLTGRFPFVAQKPVQLARMIRMNQWSFKPSDRLSRSARLLVYGLIRQNPAERPKAKEILSCDWFQSQNCEAVPTGCTSASQPRPQVTVQLVIPANGRIPEANPRIPQQLIPILMRPAVERTNIYLSRSNIRASMESCSGALHRSMNAENTIQMVPERPQVTANVCDRDSLNLTVIRVSAGARH